MTLGCGMWCMFFSVTLMQGFYEYFNATGPWCKLMAEASYTVYIIHPWVITPVSYAWVQIMAHAHDILGGDNVNQELWWPDGSSSSSTAFINENMVLAGWVFTVVISCPLVYVLAHYIRQLPHLRTIL